MRLFKRGDIYYIDYSITKGGKIKRFKESTGTTNRRKAEEILAKRKADIIEGKFGIERPEKVTFEEFRGDFLDYCRASKKRATYEYYSFMLIPLEKAFGEALLEDITPYMIEQYKIRRLEEVSKTTVKRELQALNYFFSCAILWKKAIRNPMIEVEKLREPPGRVKYLSIEQVKRLLAECAKPLYLLLLSILHSIPE